MEGFSLHADTWLHENDVTGLERAPTPSPFGHPRPAPLPARDPVPCLASGTKPGLFFLGSPTSTD